MKEATNLLPGD